MAGLRPALRPWEAASWAAAVAACAACAAVPVQNPDLFWHLSAARRMLETGSIPRADWLSFTMQGRPWLDFEWLSQLIFWAASAAGGLAGLWTLKAVLTAAWGALVGSASREAGAPRALQAAALALWAACALARSDLRPELFSLIAFAWLFLLLERWRRAGRDLSPAATFAGFVLWANLHAGFAYGLVLLAFYESGRILEARFRWPGTQGGALWPCLAGAAAGTLVQPFGPRVYEVLWRHWKDMDSLSAWIIEWRPIRLADPWHWPFWLPLLLGFGAALLHLRRRRSVPLGPLAALLYFGWAASSHARLGAYYATVALPLTLHLLQEAGSLPRSRVRAAACAVAASVFAAYVFWGGSRLGLARRAFNDRFVPIAAAEFLAENRAVLAGRRLYHPWGWGGYLGWRLYPEYRVFQDGRYIFHPLLEEAARGLESPTDWQAFLARRGVAIALLENLGLRLDGQPFEDLYMPRAAWALVHRDPRALVFVRRGSAPRDWLRKAELNAPAAGVPWGRRGY